MKHGEMVPLVQIESRILEIRGQKVMIDADLADIYGVPTKALNQAVTNCDHLTKLKYSPVLPHVFTEHGAIMAANALNSPRAVEVSVYVVRAFVRLREMIASNAELSRKLVSLEKKYDAQFKVVFDAIRSLMATPEPKKRKIGFKGE